MIPVLGVPVLGCDDLLPKLLDSLDEPVETIVVINNNRYERVVPGAQVINVHGNLGVAASWNLIIKSTPRASWWCIVNHDITFAPGDLARLTDHMEHNDGVGMLLTPSAFGITPGAIERAGWFDENFIPAYCEDNDYVYRCKLTGVPVTPLHAGLAHAVSATIRSDKRYQDENARTFDENVAYYRDKWGGDMTNEQFVTPFNKGGDPRDWRLSAKRLAELSWRI